MTQKPHISVVIPVYNEENFLGVCLRSIAAQSLQPDVVYIIDNNSTDSSMEIARQFPFVSIIKESVQGICAATKTGLDVAARHNGIILRCDADSRPLPNWIEHMAHIFSTHPKVVAATGPGSAYDATPLVRSLIDVLYMKPYFTLVGLALGQKPLFGSNFGIRARAWKKISSHTHLQTHQNIHDDIDISYHIIGEVDIYYDHTMKMPISARPFSSPSSLPKRYIAGFRSIFLHWPERAPWKSKNRS